jgi:hypothetical protein
MLVLMDNGLVGEVTASIYTPDMDGTKKYVVRTHAGIMFNVEATKCHEMTDPDFEPFMPPEHPES